MTFPAGLLTIVVTGLNVEAFDGTPLNGVVIFTPSLEGSAPAENILLEGSANGEVVNGVMTPLTIPTTDSVTPSFTYTITQRLQTPDMSGSQPAPLTGVAIPHSLGSTVDLSVLI